MSSFNAEILIIHLNGEEIIRNCLKSIFEDNPKSKVSVLFNGTTDLSKKIVEFMFPQVNSFFVKKTIGFAQACNFLIKKAKEEYVVLLNNDVEVEKGWLKNLIICAKKNDSEIVQPKILSLRNKKYFEYAGAAGGYVDRFIVPFCRGRIFKTIEEDLGQYDSEKELFWACGSCMLIKRSLFKKIGYFDEKMFMYSEELDFCWRAKLFGAKIFFCPFSKIYHVGSYSVKKENFSHKKTMLLYRNLLYTVLKNYSTKNLIINFSVLAFFETLSCFLEPKNFLPLFNSFWWILCNLKDILEERKNIQKMREIQDCDLVGIYPKSIAISNYLFRKKFFTELGWEP